MMLTHTVLAAAQPNKRNRNQPCGKLPPAPVAVGNTKPVLAGSNEQVAPPPVKLALAAPVPVAVNPLKLVCAATPSVCAI